MSFRQRPGLPRKVGANAEVWPGNADENDVLQKLPKPAQRALAAAGYVRLEQFAEVSEAELLKLHGVGPKATRMLGEALAARGLSFADG